eukprot:TRINITY_DN32023_c0_g2_i3.p1 TRINITY_DN32023_c0_g2~~TRINITY_DN32023_c0_g2_i3.p1  ORF type:complete len:232 (-),score=114.89 TRINITY_DN32023_c0_g2_i3:25-687(-)
MGRVRQRRAIKKGGLGGYGYGSGLGGYGGGLGGFGFGRRRMMGGFGGGFTLLALGGIAIGAFLALKKKKSLFGYGLPFSTAGFSTSYAQPAVATGRMVAHQRLPGETVKEVDVITRKKVPYYEEREIFEGPASVEVYQSPVREYYADTGLSSTSTVSTSGYSGAYAGGYGASNVGLEGGNTLTAPAGTTWKRPLVSSRRVPIRDRVKSSVLRRPVVTNYY